MEWKDIERSIDRTLGPSDIDDFLRCVRQSTEWHLDRLDDESKGLSPEQFEDPRDLEDYRDHLGDKAESVEAVRELADELSILALMKKVELRLNRVLEDKVPAYAGVKKIAFSSYRKALGDPAYDSFSGKKEFRELFLICNSIKHNAVVSDELAADFPAWVEGEALKGLDTTYLRLRDKMVDFVYEYVSAIYIANEP